jgi:hypothetical protein
MPSVNGTERNAVCRKNGDGTGVSRVMLSIEVTAQGEQGSSESAQVPPFEKIVSTGRQ